MTQPIEIVIRDYNSSSDDPYIYSTWTRYAWYSSVEPILLSKNQWFREKIREIKDILSVETVNVACFKNDPYVITGYIVAKGGELKWICVKKDYHNQGIENLLKSSMKGKIHDSTGTDPQEATLSDSPEGA